MCNFFIYIVVYGDIRSQMWQAVLNRMFEEAASVWKISWKVECLHLWLQVPTT